MDSSQFTEWFMQKCKMWPVSNQGKEVEKKLKVQSSLAKKLEIFPILLTSYLALELLFWFPSLSFSTTKIITPIWLPK